MSKTYKELWKEWMEKREQWKYIEYGTQEEIDKYEQIKKDKEKNKLRGNVAVTLFPSLGDKEEK